MTPQVILAQQASGFRGLRFCPELEPGYRQLRAAVLRERARLVAGAGLLIFCVFVVLDLVMLPAELAHTTVAIRLSVTCPVIALVWWLSYQRRPSDLAFERLYTLAYLAGGLSVVAIIAAARLRDFPLPYEGLLLMLMFGYFAMGLPFYGASLASALIILAYLICEVALGLANQVVMVNLFFVMTANGIGMVGAWLTESRHRAHYLDQQLIQLLHQSAAEESERKGHLITVASHDLRQPLNVIGMALTNLSAAPLPSEQLGLVQRLRATIGHFQRVLGTVLDISRINEGMIHPQIRPLDLNSVLEQLEDLTTDHADLHGIQLTRTSTEPGLHVHADPDLLLRALQNLVFNGIDHSGGTLIQIISRCQGETVKIRIADNGTGLNPDLQDRVFQPFVRSGGGRDHSPGLGLGLAIVKQLTELMHGSCGVELQPVGTTFWLELPISEAAVAGLTASPSGVPG